MRGTTIGRRIYNPCNFLTNPTSNHAPTFLSSSPFSTSSGRGRGAGNVGSPPGGQSEYGAAAPGKPDLDESKTESSESQPSGLGHGRGKPVGTGPILPAFSAFISSVKNSQPGAGRGLGTTDPGPSRPTESRPESEPPKKAEANLPPSILSGLGGAGRGKPVKQEVPSEPAKEENRHLRARSQPRSQPRVRQQKTPDGDDAVPATTKMGRQEAVKKAMELLSRGGGEGEVGGRGGGRGSFVPGRGGGRGGARGGARGRGRGRGRRGYGDKEVEYGSGMSLEGHEEDEEKFAQSVGVETMNTLVEAFEEMSGRVLPCPIEDEYVDAFDTNCSFEFEPEYLMGEFDKNPDIDEKPPMPLRDALEKVKPFMMAYMGIKTHEEWEEIVEETMKDAPLMKKIVDSYSGPDRVSGKKQKEELERVAKTIPASAPDSVKSFADRAVLSLQSNPGWGFDKKCMFMDKLAKEVSQHYK